MLGNQGDNRVRGKGKIETSITLTRNWNAPLSFSVQGQEHL